MSAGGKTETFDGAKEDSIKYANTVLKINENGDQTSVTRKYSRHQFVETKNGSEPNTTVSPIEGKTVAINTTPNGIDVTVKNGSIGDQDRESLIKSLDKNNHLYPDRYLSIGDEWEINPNFLGDLAEGTDIRTAVAKFEEVTQYMGHPCARIKVNIRLIVKNPDGMQLDMTLNGNIYYAIDIQRNIDLALGGPIVIGGSMGDSDKKGKLSGSGSCDIRMKSIYSKVAGKSADRKK
jgi:hypothetical protein